MTVYEQTNFSEGLPIPVMASDGRSTAFPVSKAFGISLRPDGHGGLGVYVPWDSSGFQRGGPLRIGSYSTLGKDTVNT